MILPRLIACLVAFAPAVSVFADELTVSFPASPRFPVFASGAPVEMVIWAQRENPAKADEVIWVVRDYLDREIGRGSVQVPEGESRLHHPVKLENLPAGYFAVSAEFKTAGIKLPRRGSRPPGMATFGVLSPLKALPLGNPAEGRFGIQGTNFIQSGVFLQGDPYDPVYPALGVRWVNVGRSWADAEPDNPGQYAPKEKVFTGEPGYMERSGLEPLFCVFNLPWWAIDFPEGVKADKSNSHQRQNFPPKDHALYATYLEKMAAHQALVRKTQSPGVYPKNYYQIGWEPDWHWKGTDAQFVELYKTASSAIRAGDPNAVIMGPGDGVINQAIARLERLLPMGFAEHLDGLAIHGYYVPFGNPLAIVPGDKLISPEDGGVVESIRKIRGFMRDYFKPDAKLFQTEWGLDYRGAYLDLDVELLKLHAAYIIRGHLLFLGEGCDMTYFFYTADYGNLKQRGEDGYGMCFNLTMPDPSFGAVQISPKPVFMAGSALTRVLEGTKTLGPVDLGNPNVHAYAFDRKTENVVALWSRDNESRTVEISVSAPRVALVDFMGNRTELARSAKGTVSVPINQYPCYLIGDIPASKTLL